MGMGVVRGEREKGSCGEGERVDGNGSTVERANGYGRRGVNGWARPHQHCRWAGLGWAGLILIGVGLGSARRHQWGCVCVNVRGSVRDREKMREFCGVGNEICVEGNENF